jgi:hypothetical protein
MTDGEKEYGLFLAISNKLFIELLASFFALLIICNVSDLPRCLDLQTGHFLVE